MLADLSWNTVLFNTDVFSPPIDPICLVTVFLRKSPNSGVVNLYIGRSQKCNLKYSQTQEQ